MATVSLQFTADTFVGTAAADEILVGAMGRLAAHDSLNAGLGVDVLKWVNTTTSFDGSYLTNSSGWDRLDFSSATTSLTVKLSAWSVNQSDNDVLTIVTGTAGVDLDTSQVGGFGTVLLAGTGLATLRNYEGQSVTIANAYDGRVQGGLGADRVQGGTGGDWISGGGGDDDLGGGQGADSLIGGDGDDRLLGGMGVDSLDGGAGDDVLTIGARDRVSGGDGVDFFVVGRGGRGVLTIEDRSAGERIDLRAFDSATSRSALNITDTAQGARIDLGAVDVVLNGVSASDLAASDFIFSGQDAGLIQVAAGTSTAVLQALIDGAAAGAVIELAAGVFDVTETLHVTRGDITIRGAGSGLTILRSVIPDAEAGSVIRVDALGNSMILATVASTATAGSTTMTLSSTTNVSVGDVIYIMQLNDDAWLSATGNAGWQRPADYDSAPARYALREMLVEVVAVSGQTVTLSHALPYTFQAGAATVSRVPMLTGVELSGFSVETTFGVANPLSFENTRPAWNAVPAIMFDGVAGGRLSDIVINNTASRGFELRRVFEITGENLTVNGAHNKGEEGNGYALSLTEAFAVDIDNFRAFDVRHAVLFSSFSAEHYNNIHVADTDRDINFHGSPDADNTIVVDRMVQDYPVGSQYQWISVGPGAFPVHPESTIAENDVTFRYLRASHHEDIVRAHVAGGDIDGQGGNDQIVGGVARDTLAGGQGDDVLTGGGGADRFLRRFGDQLDTITDFRGGVGGDVLALHGYAYARFSDLVLTQSGSDVLVQFGQDGATRLQNIQVSALTEQNFEFVVSGAARSVLAGSGLLVVGGDGADAITVGRGHLTTTSQVIGGAGRDSVNILVGGFSSDTDAWGQWRGVDVVDLRGATSISLVVRQAFLEQADADTVVLQFNATAVVNLSVGAPTVGKLILEGAATVQLATSSVQRVYVSDLVAGKVNGGSSADTIFGGALSDSLAGGAGFDSLVGGLGDDTLDGGFGNDTLIGGGGADVYVVESVLDQVVEAAAQGVDEIRAVMANYSLVALANVENLTGLSTGAQSLTGNALANIITGGVAGDVLNGGGGADTLNGGGGADALTGGGQADRLWGGAGADRFVFVGLTDSPLGLGAQDRVEDFRRTDGDKIDLSAIDAITGGVNDAFTVVSALTGVAGQLRLTLKIDHTLVEGDVTGDGVADFALQVMGTTALAAADFIL